MIFNEGGINWCAYTELELHSDNTVTIKRCWRVHRGETGHPKSDVHPNYYHEQIWDEEKKDTGGVFTDRIAKRYFVPNVGWCVIRNSQSVYDLWKE